MKKILTGIILLSIASISSAEIVKEDFCNVTVVPLEVELKESSDLFSQDQVRMYIDRYENIGYRLVNYVETYFYYAFDEHNNLLEENVPYKLEDDNTRGSDNYFLTTSCSDEIQIRFEELDDYTEDDILLESKRINFNNLSYQDAPELNYIKGIKTRERAFIELENTKFRARIKVLRKSGTQLIHPIMTRQKDRSSHKLHYSK